MKKRRTLMKYLLPAIAVGMLGYALIFITNQTPPSVAEPTSAPPTSPFDQRVAGIGIVEPESESIAIGTNLPGIVTHIYVKEGDEVKTGSPLFTIDNRDANAELDLAQARLDAAKIQAADARHQLKLYESVSDKRAISDDEISRRRFAAQLADSRVKEAEAELNVRATELERLTVNAPIDGQILQVNLRPGEYAQAGPLREPLLVLGNTRVMHVRVEIDETDSHRVSPDAQAVAILRGGGNKQVKLVFVRKEPNMRPKRSLTGDGNERVDTRVQEIVYAFDNSEVGAFVGQQMDAFIDAGPAPAKE